MDRMSFPTVAGPWELPVEGCRVLVAMRTSLMMYLFHIHVRDTVLISEGATSPIHGAPVVI